MRSCMTLLSEVRKASPSGLCFPYWIVRVDLRRDLVYHTREDLATKGSLVCRDA